jgi:hypothetical protein
MKIESKDLALRKRVGTLRGRAIIYLMTKGGLHLIISDDEQGPEILGAGPHPAVARYIAQKREPEILFRDLEKSEEINEETLQFVLPKYEKLTEQLIVYLKKTEFLDS